MKKKLSLLILSVILGGLVNICLFTFPALAAAPAPVQKFYDYENCSLAHVKAAAENLETPATGMPSCCLERGRFFDAIIKTSNDKQTQLMDMPAGVTEIKTDLNELNISSYSLNSSSPPQSKALATVIIRE